MMKKFIIVQMKIDSEVDKDNVREVRMSNIVRQVDAESRELAIGKFVVSTQNIKALKKMDIECYELSQLLKA